jgi:branched-chain amino acid transport system permease protein
MLNFAHGDIIMVGGYMIFVTMSSFGNPILGLLAACIFCVALGVTIEKIAYKPLRGASPLAVLITAIGVSYLLQSTAQMIFGTAPKMVIISNLGSVQLGGLKIPIYILITLVCSFAISAEKRLCCGGILTK